MLQGLDPKPAEKFALLGGLGQQQTCNMVWNLRLAMVLFSGNRETRSNLLWQQVGWGVFTKRWIFYSIMPRATQSGKTKWSQKLHTVTQPKHVTRKMPSGVVLLFLWEGIPVGFWKAPSTPISYLISLKQLKEISQPSPYDSDQTQFRLK